MCYLIIFWFCCLSYFSSCGSFRKGGKISVNADFCVFYHRSRHRTQRHRDFRLEATANVLDAVLSNYLLLSPFVTHTSLVQGMTLHLCSWILFHFHSSSSGLFISFHVKLIYFSYFIKYCSYVWWCPLALCHQQTSYFSLVTNENTNFKLSSWTGLHSGSSPVCISWFLFLHLASSLEPVLNQFHPCLSGNLCALSPLVHSASQFLGLTLLTLKNGTEYYTVLGLCLG